MTGPRRTLPHARSRKQGAARKRHSAGKSARDWAKLPHERLLNLRFRDLPLTIKGTMVQRCLRRLYRELEHMGLSFQPHAWLSDEWFTPDGVPGIAVPFYLAHPRLARLERRMMLEVEGGTESWCMRILRHEAGHAIDNAYRLHFKPSWRKVFGKFSQPYPDRYQPRPYSKAYVQHLDMWYAQAHPAEDFAETFAVWLTPGSRWRERYIGTSALRKLEYVDELMRGLAGQRQLVRAKANIDPISANRMTLREHYHAKQLRYGEEWPDFYDRDLRRLFSSDPKFIRNITAAEFMRRIRPRLRRVVSRWTGAYQYTIDQVLLDIIDRCHELKLRLAVPQRQARTEALMLLTVQTMNYLHEGHHLVVL